MLDFQAIKARVSYHDVLVYLSLQGKRNGEQWRGKCPACNSSNERALVLTPGKGAYCHTAGKGGDLLWLVSHVKNIGVRQAAQELVDHFGLNGQPVPQEPVVVPNAAKESDPTPKEGFKPQAYADALDYEHDACKQFANPKSLMIGYCTKGVHRGKLVIPVYVDGTPHWIGIDPATTISIPKTLKGA